MIIGKAYVNGKFLMDIEPLVYPKLYAVPCELTNYTVIVQREDGYYKGTISGGFWRVCGDDWCYTNIFPTKKAAEIFINETSPIRFLGGN